MDGEAAEVVEDIKEVLELHTQVQLSTVELKQQGMLLVKVLQE